MEQWWSNGSRVVVALSLLVGCSPGPWRASESFTADEREAVVAGEKWITERTGRETLGVVFDIPDGEDATGRVILKRHGSGGCVCVGGIGAIVADNIPPPALAWVVAHEIGHSEGLKHHDAPGLMVPTFSNDDVAVWTAEDQAACVRDGVCPK